MTMIRGEVVNSNKVYWYYHTIEMLLERKYRLFSSTVTFTSLEWQYFGPYVTDNTSYQNNNLRYSCQVASSVPFL
jgi:hypothetical protein